MTLKVYYFFFITQNIACRSIRLSTIGIFMIKIIQKTHSVLFFSESKIPYISVWIHNKVCDYIFSHITSYCNTILVFSLIIIKQYNEQLVVYNLTKVCQILVTSKTFQCAFYKRASWISGILVLTKTMS